MPANPTDFSAKQIRVSNLIASGGIGPAQIMIYPLIKEPLRACPPSMVTYTNIYNLNWFIYDYLYIIILSTWYI